MEKDSLCSMRVAAARLGISVMGLRRLIACGGVRAVRVGKRRILIPESETDRVVQNGTK
jgi:excisionase family DNA binding protein